MRPEALSCTTPLGQDAELLRQMDQAITEHAYPLAVWSPGKWVVDTVQRSSAILEAGRYLVWLEMSLPTTPICVSVEAGEGVVSEDRTRLLEFQIAT